ncbi:MAG: acyl-CoA dehydrogenase family protein [Polyangia bacterium]
MPQLEARHVTLASESRAVLADAALHGAPLQVLAQLALRGLLRACVPAAYGGLREAVEMRDLVVLRLLLGELSPLADTMFAMQGLGSYPVQLAGSEAQKRALLPGAADGSLVCAFAITEPEAGSDVGSMQTRAERRGDEWVLTGTKTFISNAGLAHRYVLFARTSDDRKRGISAFVIEGDRAGLEVEPLKLLGDHPVGTLHLRGVMLPAAALVGQEGDGLKLALSTLDFFRATVGAAAAGMAQRALDEARARVKSRVQFGKPIAEHQATQLAIAEMAVDVRAARLLCLDAAETADLGGNARDAAQKAAMAKLFATEAAQRVVDRALQLWGGAGLVEGTTVERLYREVRALRIYEGTSEIQKLVIARTELART